jgi:hypothetical protein
MMRSVDPRSASRCAPPQRQQGAHGRVLRGDEQSTLTAAVMASARWKTLPSRPSRALFVDCEPQSDERLSLRRGEAMRFLPS